MRYSIANSASAAVLAGRGAGRFPGAIGPREPIRKREVSDQPHGKDIRVTIRKIVVGGDEDGCRSAIQRPAPAAALSRSTRGAAACRVQVYRGRDPSAGKRVVSSYWSKGRSFATSTAAASSSRSSAPAAARKAEFGSTVVSRRYHGQNGPIVFPPSFGMICQPSSTVR